MSSEAEKELEIYRRGLHPARLDYAAQDAFLVAYRRGRLAGLRAALEAEPAIVGESYRDSMTRWRERIAAKAGEEHNAQGSA